MRREGTKNYYYLDADTESINQLLSMIRHAIEIHGRDGKRSWRFAREKIEKQIGGKKK